MFITQTVLQIKDIMWYLFQIALRLGVPAQNVQNTIIWGNHSSTQYPDVRHAFVKSGSESKPVLEAVKDDNYINNDFIKVNTFV